MLLLAYPRSWSPHFLLLGGIPLAWLAVREFHTILGLRDPVTRRFTPAALTGQAFTILLLFIGHAGRWELVPVWALLFALALVIPLLPRFPGERPLLTDPMRVYWTSCYIGLGLSALFGLRDLGEAWIAAGYLPSQTLAGGNFLNAISFIPVIGAWCYDAAALGTGSFAGLTPLAPTISPKKSWEGYLGGLAGVGLGGAGLLALVAHHGGFDPGPGAYLLAIVLAMLLGTCSQIGDLVISAFKRESGVKDSANLIPSQGGILDKVDGLVLVAPVALGMCYLGAWLWGLG